MKDFSQQFGGKATSALKAQYAQSANWKDGKFENLVETTMEFSIQSMPKMLYKQFFETKGRNPKENLPILPFDKHTFLVPSDEPKIIWYGHSVVLMRINGKTLLIDPMLGPNAAPIAPFAVKRFSDNSLAVIDELPPIDLLLMTHDHYDHLDYASIQKLKGKTSHYFVALGVKRHLESWGIAGESITEFDWWDQQTFEGIDITFTPTRHFSGRGLKDRAKSLWGGWAFKTENENLYFSGDGGYGEHFKEVGKRLGPFDFGWMECGQYNPNWHQIHMYPEESVQAGRDAKVQKAMAVHWGGFALAQHHWKEPIERFMAAAKQAALPVITPRVGELFQPSNTQFDVWWEDIE